MENVSLTDYMNNSLRFSNKALNYYLKYDVCFSDQISINEIINKFNLKAFKDTEFRNSVFKWFNGQSSTIELIYFCKEINLNYWDDLKHSNIIDYLDSININ